MIILEFFDFYFYCIFYFYILLLHSMTAEMIFASWHGMRGFLRGPLILLFISDYYGPASR